MAGLGGGPEEMESKEDSVTGSTKEESGNSASDSQETEQIKENGDQDKSELLDTKENVTLSHPEETRLSGWLGKLTALAFVKTNKLFWFVFGDDTCKLYYYRNPQDLLPLGEIDISNAFFTFDPNVTDRPGLFEIRSEGKVHYLDAQERHRMVYWLQELQRKRREFSQKRTTLSSERVQWTVKKRLQHSGLVGDSVNQSSDPVVNPDPGNAPMDNIRITHSESSNKLSHWNLKKEIRDAVFSIKSNLKLSSTGQREGQCPPSPEGTVADWTVLESEAPSTEMMSVNIDSGPVSPTSPTSKSHGLFKSTFKKIAGKKPSMGDGFFKQDSRTHRAATACVRCKHMTDDLVSAREELQTTEEELHANREIIKLLQKEVDVLRTDIKSMKELSALSTGEEQQEMLRQRDKHIVEMRHSMSSLSEDRSELKQQSKIQESELRTQKEQLVMYQDMLEAKDQVIMQLTNQIFELESAKGDNPNLPPSPPRAPVIVQNTKELESLKDTCQAYELQNKFLTKEILELNQLRQNDEAREKMLLINYATLEAEYYKTQSRYLILLNENKAPVMEGGEGTGSQEVVSQLLEEAMSTETQDTEKRNNIYMASNSMQEYDRYGFLKRLGDDDDDNVLLARADQFQRQSAELANKIKVSDEANSHHVKWENFMVNQSNRPLVRTLELKILIRSGIPHGYREQVWKGCVNQHIGESRDKLGPGYYKSLVTRAKDTKSNPAAKQIELDLLRTLPNNRHFETLECDGVKKLRKVLLAFSAQNPIIGYCQGLNRLAAIALLFLSEEDAFWCLVSIVEHLMPQDYFTTTLAAAQADQRVLKDMVQEKLPKLFNHLEHHEVDLSLFTFNWFLTVFVDGVPPETFLRVWDAFLYEGSKVLFRFAIAFLKYVEEDVLKQNTSFLVSRYMRIVGEKMTDARGICKIAFHDLNPFPMRNIASKRMAHLNQIKNELAELDIIRQEFKSERVPEDRLEYYSDDDLDDS